MQYINGAWKAVPFTENVTAAFCVSGSAVSPAMIIAIAAITVVVIIAVTAILILIKKNKSKKLNNSDRQLRKQADR